MDESTDVGTTRALEALVPKEHFPLTDEVVYLNAASMGLIPEPVIREHERFARELGRAGARAYFELEHHITQAPREAGARLLGCEPSSIGLTTSVSEANAQIAWWVRPGEGTNVVSIDLEEPAVTYPWLRVAEETGAEVRLAAARHDPAPLSIEHLVPLVDDRTVAICVSHVEWITGHRFDLAALAELAHAHDAILVVDAIQSAGVVPLDVRTTGVDVLVTGAYKWLCSFSGVALCYLRPELADRFRPILAGSMSAHPAPPYDDFDAAHLELAAGPSSLEFGNASHAARMVLAPAIDYLSAVGIDRIHAHTLALTRRLSEGVLRLGGEVITPADDAARAAIITARFAGHDAVGLVAALKERGILALPRMGYVRFAPHLYTSGSDIDQALDALDEILATTVVGT